MKTFVHYYFGICLFMLVNQLAMAQVKNLNAEQPNAFEKYFGTKQMQPTRGVTDAPGGATDALVYIDYEIQNGQVLAALTHLGYNYVVATDWTDFNNKLSYPNYQLAVMFNQNSGIGANLTTVTNFISAGGSMVYADWTHTASFATLFQATFTSSDNQTVMSLSSTIATGLPNPLTLVNTGWGIFSTGLTATGGAEVLATFPNGNAAIVKGNSGKTIILGYLSDTPPAAYRQQLFENLFISVVPPSGPTDPTSITATSNPICRGTSTQLTANGVVGTVYWYTGSCGTTGYFNSGSPITISPTTTTTYYARNYDNGQYSTGCASLSVTVYPFLTAGISGGTSPICYNTSPGTFTATGGGGTGSYTYLWYKDAVSTGITTQTYNPGNLTSSSSFYCAITSGSCGTVSSNTISITVYGDLIAGISGGTSPICYNTSPGTFTATGGGGTGSYTYLWYKDAVSTGITTQTYNPGNLTSSSSFYCAITSGSCGTVSSNTINITVYSDLTAGISGGTSPICYNSAPGTFTATGGGGNGSYTYLWYKDGTTTGVTTQTYAPGNLTATSEFYCDITSGSCGTVSSNLITIVVDPTTVGGAVTGGGVVCYGTNSTLLTLSGHTGLVVKWQYSTNVTDWVDIANTTDTYTAENLIVDTWFRAVVKSGECLIEESEATQITMFTDYHISGYAKYYNNPKTPLDGLKITLKQGATTLGSMNTGLTGFYQFTGLVNGTYDLEITSAHISGLWQTWSGVNNTDYLLVSRHATAVAPLAVEPPLVRVSANVIQPATTAILVNDANAIRNAAKYGWFMTGTTTPWFDIPKWVFSGTTTITPITGMSLNCDNITRNIYGLCAGDVNGSYIPPSGYKQATDRLELVNRGTLPVTPEITFPVRAENDMEIGAITLMLDFDATQLNITGVEMPNQGDETPYYIVTGNMLHIGWMSLNPVRVIRGETVLVIHTRMTNMGMTNMGMTNDELRIRFALNENPLCELADAEGNVIDGARLSVTDAGNNPQTSDEAWINVFPNPARDFLNIEILLETSGFVKVEIVTTQGSVINTANISGAQAGWNKTVMDIRNASNGIYILRVSNSERTFTSKIIVNN